MTAQARYVGVARPPGGIDPHPPREVVDLTGPAAQAGPPPYSVPTAPASSTVDGPRDADLNPPPEPETRPWVRATVAAAEIQPAGYGRFSVHRKRLRRAILRRYELLVWACLATVVAGVALVVVRGLPAAHPVSAAPPRTSAAEEEGVPAIPVDCAFAACPAPRLSGAPTRVRIPAIRVDSSLELLSLDTSGHLQAPKDYQRAGWWTKGVAPGDTGPAVIAGHVDSVNGPAVFFELNTLRTGDLVEVDRGGQTVTFRVTETEQYPKNSFPTDRVYKPTPGPELRLITCGGSFDQSRGSYRDNIVVYAIAI